MKITILTYGSRGDVQPFLALAVGLQNAGHDVMLAVPHRFESFVNSYGIFAVPLAGDPEVISERLNEAGANPVRMVRAISDYIFAIAPQVSRSAFAACEGADFLIHSFLFTVGGHSWAYEHGIPDVSVQTFPMFAPTRAFPNVAAPKIPSGILSYISHWFASKVFWYGGNMGYGPARRANPDIPFPKKLFWPFDDLPHHPQTPILFAYSPSVLPPPSDWGDGIHVAGYFFLNEVEYQPPAELKDFLAAGAPPVCVTFGSMIRRDAGRIYRAVLNALKETQNRAVILSGWGGWQEFPSSEDMIVLDAVPHSWLFPRCKAVIHHGGAGTTAAGLRAGIPNLVVSFAADQPFWGRRVYEIGAGPVPIPVRKLTKENLCAALIEANSDLIRNGSQAAGRKIRAEDGVGQVIKLIDKLSREGYRTDRSTFFKV